MRTHLLPLDRLIIKEFYSWKGVYSPYIYTPRNFTIAKNFIKKCEKNKLQPMEYLTFLFQNWLKNNSQTQFSFINSKNALNFYFNRHTNTVPRDTRKGNRIKIANDYILSRVTEEAKTHKGIKALHEQGFLRK